MKVNELLCEETLKQKRERKDASTFRRDYQKWRRLVNVPTTVLRALLPTERGKKTGLSARDLKNAQMYRMTNSTVRAVYRMRTTPLSQWKTADINWMYRQLQYIEKFRSKAKQLPLMQDGKPTDALKNLWAWGHVPKGLKPTAKMVREDAAAVEPISPHNVDDVYRVGGVTFDNVNGGGATPDNANVMYKGFVAFMKPSDFLSLAVKEDRSDDAKAIEELMRAGQGFGNPNFYLNVSEEDEPFKVRIVSHEGRARALAFKAINGDVEMPVQMFPRYLRARNLSPEWFERLRESGIIGEDSSEAKNITFKKIFWNGTEL